MSYNGFLAHSSAFHSQFHGMNASDCSILYLFRELNVGVKRHNFCGGGGWLEMSNGNIMNKSKYGGGAFMETVNCKNL